MKAFRSLPLFVVFLLFGGCQTPANQHTLQAQPPVVIESPATEGSAEPNLIASPDGDAYLTWISSSESGESTLLMSRFDGAAWTTPRIIAGGTDWFVNWADFPSLSVANEQWMAAHYLAKSGDATFAYDVMITTSKDGGDSWSPPFSPHRDGTQTEHGFVSILPWSEGRFFASWLDGRFTGGGGHGGHGTAGAMTLRGAFFDVDGNLFEEEQLDERICDCCQTSAVRINEGIVVAYRDRSDDEIRDISVVRYENGKWSEPARVHADNWQIAGCPVNGPALAASDDLLAVAWFTAAEGVPKVRLAISADGGATFGAPAQINMSNPLGRVDAKFVNDRQVLISWLESTEDEAEVLARVVELSDADSLHLGEPFKIADTSPSRQSGFPQMVRTTGGIVFAWTEVLGENRTKVRTAFSAFEN